MKRKLVACFLLGMLLAASAGAQTRKVQQQNLERYVKYAGDPIDQFQFWSIYQWALVGPEKVVIWTTINDAYLVTVEKPCTGLEWAKGVAVTSKQEHIVSSKFDYVEFGKDRCKIEEIRPIDYRRMQKDEHAAKEGS